jgi:AcrR family transcriptional regulator
MAKTTNSSVWVEEGYKLFATEGLSGLHIEKLARQLGLNKSGFYHYFGDLESFCTDLGRLHEKKVSQFLEEAKQAQTLDPDYLNLLTTHPTMIMFQVQLTRHKGNRELYQLSEAIDARLDQALQKLWADYLGIQDKPDLVIRYFSIIRDMFYTRASLENINYEFLRGIVLEAKKVASEMLTKETSN